jgi:hypothetical protein
MKRNVENVLVTLQQGQKPLSDDEMDTITTNTDFRFVNDLTGSGLIGWLRQELRYKPKDLIVLNPLLAYTDALDIKEVRKFCRNELNPLLTKFKVGAVVVHHPPKPSRSEASEWNLNDYAYSGFGSSDLANWARAVIAFEPCKGVIGTFRFRAAKNGAATGWKDESGNAAYERYFCWDKGAWRDANADDIRAVEEAKAAAKNGHSKGVKTKYSDDPLLSLLCGHSFTFEGYRKEVADTGCTISKTTLWDKWQKWITNGLLVETGDQNGGKKYTRNPVRKSISEPKATEPIENPHEH